MEDKLSDLERANFDLKMRIYYLNNKLAEAEQGGYLEDSAEKVVNLLQQRDSNSEKLKEDNAASSRRISELETELNLVKTKLDATMKSRDVTLTKARDSSVLQMEENLKRERQAALAVAQHDSSVIIQLEAEIKKLNDRHASDLLLISEASEKCARLMTGIGEKDRDVERKAEALHASKQQIEVLQEKIKSQDLMINELNNRLQMSFEQRRVENRPQYPSTSLGSSPSRLMPPPTGNMGSFPAYVNMNSGSAHAVADAHASVNSSVGDATFASPKPAPKLGAPHMSSSGFLGGSRDTGTQQAYNNEHTSSTSGVYTGAAAGEMHSYHRSLRDKYFQSQSSIGLHPSDLHQPTPHGQTADMVRIEILQVRSENESLKKQLETERSAMSNLQSVLNNVRTAAEEITLLEAEEIARLESEVEKMADEKNGLMKNAKKNQETIEQLRVQVFQLETELNDVYAKHNHGTYRSSSNTSPRKASPGRRQVQKKGTTSASMKSNATVARTNSFEQDDVGSHEIDGAARAYGGHGERFVPSPKLPSRLVEQNIEQQQSVINMYRWVAHVFSAKF